MHVEGCMCKHILYLAVEDLKADGMDSLYVPPVPRTIADRRAGSVNTGESRGGCGVGRLRDWSL